MSLTDRNIVERARETMFCQADNHGYCVIVKNLDQKCTTEALSKAFSSFGYVTSSKVERPAGPSSPGYGLLYFLTSYEADQAIAKMNGKVLFDKKMYVLLGCVL